MPAPHLQYQDYTSTLQTPQGVWRWTVRVDVSQASLQFQVRDILSPYGILRDSIPLPGDVVQAMADMMRDLALAFAPHMVVTPVALTLTLDEGRGYGVDVPLQVTNDGPFGSLLSGALTTSAPWLVTAPTTVGGLGSGETGTVQVRATSLSLLAVNSPYAETITIQDSRATNSPLVVPVTVVVRPKAHIQVLPASLNFFVPAPLSGPFPTIPDQVFQIQNTGPAGSVLDYQVKKLTGLATWLSFTPSSGTLAAAGVQNISVLVTPPEGMLRGVYTETLRVSGYSDNSYQDVAVTFTVM